MSARKTCSTAQKAGISNVSTRHTPQHTSSTKGATHIATTMDVATTPSPAYTCFGKLKQLFKDDIPADAGSLKVCHSMFTSYCMLNHVGQDNMYTHFCLLTGCSVSDDILQDPSLSILSRFHSHFSKEEDIYAACNGSPLISKFQVKVQPYIPQNEQSTQSRNLVCLSMVEESVANFMAVKMSQIGVEEWTPNYNEPPSLLYNTAMSLVFIDTFHQAVVAGAYDYVANLHWKKHMTDMDLLVTIYEHIVFHHFFKLWKIEQQSPGMAGLAKQCQAMYAIKQKVVMFQVSASLELILMNSKQKVKACKVYLKNNKHYCLAKLLIDVEATSDEERDPSGGFVGKRPICHVYQWPEHSQEAEACIQLIDKAIKMSKGLKRNIVTWCNPIVVPLSFKKQQLTLFSALSTNLLIDYYDPDYFNSLPLELQKKANIHVLALPSDVSKSLNWQHKGGKATGCELMR